MTRPPRTVVLRPLPATRIASMIPAAGIIFMAALLVRDVDLPGWNDTVVLVAVVAVSVFLAVRAWRYSISLTPDRIVVRGFLRDRTVERSLVTEVTDSAWLVWETPHAHRRLTPLATLWVVPQMFPRYKAHAELCLHRAQMWAR